MNPSLDSNQVMNPSRDCFSYSLPNYPYITTTTTKATRTILPSSSHSTLSSSSFPNVSILSSSSSHTDHIDDRVGSRQPGPYDVTCGRGKGNYNKPGNQRFRTIIAQHIDQYLSAKTKYDKTIILDCIAAQVHEQNNHHASFLKYNTKQHEWIVMSTEEIREKVGHAMREAISSTRAANDCRTKSNNNNYNTAAAMEKHKQLFHLQQHIFYNLLEEHQEMLDNSVQLEQWINRS